MLPAGGLCFLANALSLPQVLVRTLREPRAPSGPSHSSLLCVTSMVSRRTGQAFCALSLSEHLPVLPVLPVLGWVAGLGAGPRGGVRSSSLQGHMPLGSGRQASPLQSLFFSPWTVPLVRTSARAARTQQRTRAPRLQAAASPRTRAPCSPGSGPPSRLQSPSQPARGSLRQLSLPWLTRSPPCPEPSVAELWEAGRQGHG